MSAVDHCSGHLTVEVVDPLICHDPQVVFYGVEQIVQREYPRLGSQQRAVRSRRVYEIYILREHFLQQCGLPAQLPGRVLLDGHRPSANLFQLLLKDVRGDAV